MQDNIHKDSNLTATYGKVLTENDRRFRVKKKINDIANSNEFPFFIQWMTKNHPSLDGKAVAKIKKIVISSKNQLDNSLFNSEIKSAISNLEIEWVNPVNANHDTGIIEIHFNADGSDIIIN